MAALGGGATQPISSSGRRAVAAMSGYTLCDDTNVCGMPGHGTHGRSIRQRKERTLFERAGAGFARNDSQKARFILHVNV